MTTVTLDISNTTFVSSAQPENNFSFYPLMYAGTDPSFQTCVSLLQIDLSSITVTSVDSAILKLSVIVKSGEAPSPIVVNRVEASYDTATVTYNAQPAYVPSGAVINVEPSDLYTTVEINITSLVNQWLSGTYPNYGIALTNADGTTVVQFGTDHIVYEPYFPRITLTYAQEISSTAVCFSFAQLAHIIEQIIAFYPETVITVFTRGLVASSVTGTPYQLFSSPEGTYGGLFILLDAGQSEAISLNAIAAIYTGDGTVYNPGFSFLTSPEFPAGCDTNLITAYHDYLPLGEEVTMYIGGNITASGAIYKNEYGILVLSDADGNTPIFVPVLNINVMLPAAVAERAATPGIPRISVAGSA